MTGMIELFDFGARYYDNNEIGPFPVNKAEQNSMPVYPMLEVMENFVPMYDHKGKMLMVDITL